MHVEVARTLVEIFIDCVVTCILIFIFIFRFGISKIQRVVRPNYSALLSACTQYPFK